MASSNSFDPNEMFKASRSLLSGAKIIIVSEGIHDRGQTRIPTLPVIVCCALAIEIGIKALLTLEMKRFPSKGGGHSLKALFETLPALTQQSLLSFQYQFTKLSPLQAKAKLKEEDTTFVTWRYAYEHARLSTSPSFLYEFGVAVSEFLRERLEASTIPSVPEAVARVLD